MSATGALNEFVSHCRDLGGNGVGKRENEVWDLEFHFATSLKGCWQSVFDEYSLSCSLVI